MASDVSARGAKRGVGETRKMVKRYAKAGLSPREIALQTGISTQAVHQHLHSLRKAGELPPEEEAS